MHMILPKIAFYNIYENCPLEQVFLYSVLLTLAMSCQEQRILIQIFRNKMFPRLTDLVKGTALIMLRERIYCQRRKVSVQESKFKTASLHCILDKCYCNVLYINTL